MTSKERSALWTLHIFFRTAFLWSADLKQRFGCPEGQQAKVSYQSIEIGAGIRICDAGQSNILVSLSYILKGREHFPRKVFISGDPDFTTYQISFLFHNRVAVALTINKKLSRRTCKLVQIRQLCFTRILRTYANFVKNIVEKLLGNKS